MVERLLLSAKDHTSKPRHTILMASPSVNVSTLETLYISDMMMTSRFPFLETGTYICPFIYPYLFGDHFLRFIVKNCKFINLINYEMNIL